MVRLGEETATKGDLNSTHLSFVAQQCKLQVWGRHMSIPSKFPRTNSYHHGLGIVLALASCYLYKKSPAFDIKQSPPGRSPEDRQVHAHAYFSSIKAQSCFV